MKITISNKKLKKKPLTEEEKRRYFGKKGSRNRIQFETKEIELVELEKLIGDGYTLAYQFLDDNAMERKDTYIGTDFIVIDVDETDYSIEQVLDKAEHQPTIIHTTLSDMTEAKHHKHCYHLIYCMNSTLFGEDNFTNAFQYFEEGIESMVDLSAKDCHRLVFSSNRNLPTFMCINKGVIYDVNSLPFMSDESVCPKIEVSSLYNLSTTDILATRKNGQQGTGVSIMFTNAFNLDESFFLDFNKMSRKDFIAKYDTTYPWITSTKVSYNENGYADLTSVDYYEVDSKYRWNSELGKGQRRKIAIGKRDNTLFIDAINYMHANTYLSKEEFVLDLTREVYYNYDNSDGEMTNSRIVGKAMYVWNNKSSLTAQPHHKKFKIDKEYWTSSNVSSRKAVGIVMGLMKDKEIGKYVDSSLTMEANIKQMKQNGVKITKSRLSKFCNKYNCHLASESDIRDNRVLELYNENKNRSCRDIAEICKKEGIKVGKTTINTIIRNYRGNGQ